MNKCLQDYTGPYELIGSIFTIQMTIKYIPSQVPRQININKFSN